MRALDDLEVDALAPSNSDVTLLHSVWLDRQDATASVPAKFDALVSSWKRWHPESDVLHVLWNGVASARFLQRFYPSQMHLFCSLLSEAQRCDYLRLLLLHHYGGVYVDIDQECLGPFLRTWSSTGLYLLQSPLFTEEYTNCLMGSPAGPHEFWLVASRTLEESVWSLRAGTSLSRTTRFYFQLPLVGRYVQFLFTDRITGPSILDRTLLRHPRFLSDVRILLADEYYDGALSVHHENAAWFPARTVRVARVVATGVLAIFFAHLFSTR